MIFLDSNIIIALLNDGIDPTSGIGAMLADRRGEGTALVCDLIVVAEVAAGSARPDELQRTLTGMDIMIVDLDVPTALRAAAAFREYRTRGGARTTILPDFLIAAHAATLDAALMTRDRRLGSYFPELTLITPETQP